MSCILPIAFALLVSTVGASENYKDVCGKAFTRNDDGPSKVIAGPDDHLGDWPWLASLHDGWCSASLISHDYVITALHCYADSDCYPDPSMCEHFNVRVGSVDKAKGGEVFGIEEVHFFNDSVTDWKTDLQNAGHDIVVLKLNKSVSFSDTVNPICLSDALVEDHTTYVVAVGWGYHYDGDNATRINTEILKESIIPLRPVEYCRKSFPTADIEVCAGSDHRDTSGGDSGGPIQFELNKRWHLAGDTSRGPVPGQDDFIGHGAYARSAAHCDWIAEVTKGDVVCIKDSA